jgi:hypothetical protein
MLPEAELVAMHFSSTRIGLACIFVAAEHGILAITIVALRTRHTKLVCTGLCTANGEILDSWLLHVSKSDKVYLQYAQGLLMSGSKKKVC